MGVEGWGEELANPRPPMNNNNIDDDEDKRVKIELTDTASISGPLVLVFKGAESDCMLP